MDDKTLPGIGPAAHLHTSQRETLKAPKEDTEPPPVAVAELATTQPAIRAIELPEDRVDPRTAPTARPAPLPAETARPAPLAARALRPPPLDVAPPPVKAPESARTRVARAAGAVEESVRFARKDPRREDD